MGKVGQKILSVFLCFLLIFTDIIFYFSSTNIFSRGLILVKKVYADDLPPPQPQCLTPSNAVVPPIFNNATGLCETPYISTSGACPDGYVPAGKKCIARPYCLAPYVYSLNDKSCVLASFYIGGGGSGVNGTGSGQDTSFGIGDLGNNSICARDINNDGEIDVSEVGQCVNATTQAGSSYNLCTLDIVECNLNATAGKCPDGMQLDPDVDLCVADPEVKCSLPGFTYKRDIEKCIKDVICPSNGTLDSTIDQCVVTLSSQNCPSDPPGFTYSNSSHACVIDVQCKQPLHYNSATKRCEVSVVYKCPKDTTYNATTKLCEAKPKCPDDGGWWYSDTANACVKLATTECPTESGWQYNPSRNRCEKTPECPASGIYNRSTNRCEAGAIKDCSSYPGMIYNNQTGKCEANPNLTPVNIPPKTYTFRVSKNNTLFTTTIFLTAEEAQALQRIDASWSTNTHSVYCAQWGESCDYTGCYSVCVSWIDVFDDDSSGFEVSFNGQSVTEKYGDCECGSCGSCGVRDRKKCPCEHLMSLYPTTKYVGSNTLSIKSGKPDKCCSGGSTAPVTITLIFGTAYTYTCTQGTYNNSTGKCEATPQLSCPSGYDLLGNICVTSHPCLLCNCRSLDTYYDVCYTPPNYRCPSGSSYDSNLGMCVKRDGICPSETSLNGYTDKCEASPTKTCPSPEYTLDSSNSVCYQKVDCPSGSQFDPNLNKCKIPADQLCPSGYTYISGNQCQSNPGCPQDSQYSTTIDACVTPPDYNCPIGSSYNPTTKRCEAYVECGNGTQYDPNLNACTDGHWVCPWGPDRLCALYENKYVCSPHDCGQPEDTDTPDEPPSGLEDDAEKTDTACLGTVYIFNGKKMRCRPPGLQVGFLNNCCNKAQGRLYDNTGSLYGTFTTVKNVIAAIAAAKEIVKISYYTTKIASGEYELIGNTIYTWKDGTQKIVATVGDAQRTALEKVTVGMKPDEAIQTATTSYISNLKAEIALAIINLAVSQVIDDPIIQSTVNLSATLIIHFYVAPLSPVTIALAVVQLALAFFAGSCDEQDIITSTLKKSGYCYPKDEHWEKCIKKFPLGGCVQKAKVFCCFNSKLARIIHEQGRPQLSTDLRNWGSAKKPKCRGFTPEEFQALDFSQMDLSEYYEEIERNIRENIDKALNTQLEEKYQELKRGDRATEEINAKIKDVREELREMKRK